MGEIKGGRRGEKERGGEKEGGKAEREREGKLLLKEREMAGLQAGKLQLVELQAAQSP